MHHPLRSHPAGPAAGLAAALALAASGAAAAAGERCEAHSPATPLTVVELYTSEGCSSCPPADRWLSTLASRTDVLPLAFHVSYWDALGWVDRFAQPAFNERQRKVQAATAGRYVYTPQVVVNGQDWRQWSGGLPAPAQRAAEVDIALTRQGDQVTARITPAPGQHGLPQWAGYWAVLEDGHRSAVKAGENAGEMLRHDSVVRTYQPVMPWPGAAPAQFSLQLPAAQAPSSTSAITPGSASPRRIAFVVTDPALTRPIQAAVLGC